MKNTFLKLALPMTLATLLANADQLSFTKNMPMNSKKIVNENPLPTYDNRVDFGTGLFGVGAGVTYTRVKPDSTYIGIGTFFDPHGVGISAMAGYNFILSQKDTLTPAAGLSYYDYYTKSRHFLFPVLGVEYEHAFNSVFSLGAEVASVISGNFNFTVGVPFTFHFGSEKRWEVRLTPRISHAEAWIFSNTSTTLNCSLGYRF